MNKNLTIGIIAVSVVALTGLFLFTGRNTSNNETMKPISNKTAATAPSDTVTGSPVVDIARCNKQPNDAYTCPMNAFTDFGPITIIDTTSKKTCEVSYRKNGGFSFKGSTKTGLVMPVLTAVALYPSGKVATIAASAAQTVSIHMSEDGKIDHTLFVDSNYSAEQCLIVP